MDWCVWRSRYSVSSNYAGDSVELLETLTIGCCYGSAQPT